MKNYVIFTIGTLLTTSLIFVYIYGTYHDSLVSIKNSTMTSNQEAIYRAYFPNKTFDQNICNQKNNIECFSLISNYLSDNVFVKHNKSFYLSVQFDDSGQGEKIADIISNLFITIYIYFALTIMYIVVLFMVKSNMKINNHYNHIPWFISYIVFLIIIYSVMGNYIHKTNQIIYNGFVNGANIYGVGSHDPMINPQKCTNNIDCYDRMINLWTNEGVDLIIINDINLYSAHHEIVLIFLPLINFVILIAFMLHLWDTIRNSYQIVH